MSKELEALIALRTSLCNQGRHKDALEVTKHIDKLMLPPPCPVVYVDFKTKKVLKIA